MTIVEDVHGTVPEPAQHAKEGSGEAAPVAAEDAEAKEMKDA